MFEAMVQQLVKPLTEKQVATMVKKIPVVSVKVKKYK
jgi:hypothetical protein